MGRNMLQRSYSTAMALKRERTKEHLQQMLTKSRDMRTDNALVAFLESAQSSGPVLLQKKLQSANRVRQFIDKNETTISTAKLLKECSLKCERSNRADRSLGFLLFFISYAVALYLQRNGERSEMVTRSMLEYFVFSKYYAPTSAPTPGLNFTNCTWSCAGMNTSCESSCTEQCTDHRGLLSAAGCNTLPAELKGFTDIVTLEDFWDWLQLLMVERFYKWHWENGQPMQLKESNTWLQKIRPITGLRIVQQRALPGVETQHNLGGGCWNYNAGNMRKFSPSCYDDLVHCRDGSCVLGTQDVNSFGTFTDSTKYYHQQFDTGYLKMLYPKEVGYFVFLPAGGPNAKMQAKLKIDELKADRWIDSASQRVRIDFLALNADERLCFLAHFVLQIHPSGLIEPIALVDTFQVNYYSFTSYLDVLRIIAEGAVVFLWCYNLILQCREVSIYWKENPALTFMGALHGNFNLESHSCILDVQLILCPVLFVLWAFATIDPYNGQLQVSENLATWDKREIFSSEVMIYSQAYFILTGVMFLLFVLRTLQQARVNPRFSVLSESLDKMKIRLLNFAFVVVICVIMLTCMAVTMFGDKIATLSEWDLALVACTELLRSGAGGGKKAKGRRGGGDGAASSLEYSEIFAVAPRTAWVWYYPYFAIMMMVVINVVVAIIGEAYNRAQSQRAPDSVEFNLTPSEALQGNPTKISHQLVKGTTKRFKTLTGSLNKFTLEKHEIAKMLLQLPPTWDAECSTAAELQKASEIYGLPFNDHNIKWTIERYPCIINSADEMETLLIQRTPAPPSAKKRLAMLCENMEDVVNRQSSLHAKLDLLVRMATF